MSKFLETIENLTRRIPGYKGYAERESMRDTDKKLREHISKKLLSIKGRMEDMKAELLQKGIIDYLAQLDNTTSVIDRLANSVLYSSRGYGSLFGNNKIYETELEKLYNFDMNFLNSMEGLENSLDNIWKTEEKEFPAKIREIHSIITGMEASWKDRDNVLSSFQ